MRTNAQQPRRGPGVWRIIQARPRLFVSWAVGTLVAVALAALTSWRAPLRGLVGWDVGVALYLGLVGEMILRADEHEIRRRAASQDEGKFAILVLTVGAALVSLLAIVALLGTSGAGVRGRRPGELLLALVTIGLSWACVHPMFALHYAHEFYDESGGGLAFPGGNSEPDYWDFLYFAVVIGMCSQVSDVGITSRAIRRTVAAHGVVSFFFNAALLALTVNIAASAI
jgi:uncharacterized membrane protein